ncbi:MAG: hypothetical protein AAF702_32330 [Chloroflexota bacterium]
MGLKHEGNASWVRGGSGGSGNLSDKVVSCSNGDIVAKVVGLAVVAEGSL